RERQQRLEATQTARAGWQARQEEAHAKELAVNELRHRRDALCARLREDYDVDLGELYRQAAAGGPGPADVGPDPARASEEVEEVRRKLSRLGSVNREALEE